MSADPLDQALSDYWQGDPSATVYLRSPFAGEQALPIAYFFRDPDEFPLQEWTAISLCRGRVLDIGAGSGCHSLVLQQQGYAVWALDHSAVAVQILQERGVQQVVLADIFHFQPPLPFETLLLLMNGIGLVKTLSGLQQFLQLAHDWLLPNGQILLDSTDLRDPPDGDEESLPDPNSADFHEVVFEVEYQGKAGDPLPWLFIAPERLSQVAAQTDWFCQVVYQDEEGSYLARLTSTRAG
ncbi:MAG: class I SAM-dependent methyltransferase [Cyanobacteriota bacterium]|nr:class I SAM-dependent methyltransferase [Cyanobacteriota bacterium]